jgi:hypothetical protein
MDDSASGSGVRAPAPAVPPPLPPAPSEIDLGGTSVTRSAKRKRLFVSLAIIVGCTVIAVATGAIRFSFSAWVQNDPGPTPASALPSLGTAAHGRFSGSGIAFRYPKNWMTDPDFPIGSNGVAPTGSVVVGMDGRSNVIVETFTLRTPVTSMNLAQQRHEVSSVVASWAQQSNGSVDLAPVDAELGNIPAFLARIRTLTPDGVPLHSTLYFGYRGTTEYFVNCESDGTDLTEITKGCAQIVRSFHVAT